MNVYDYSKYNAETLNTVPLYELRIIGRTLGVKSPTSMKKPDLINAICDKIANNPHPSTEIGEESVSDKEPAYGINGGKLKFSDSVKVEEERKKEEKANSDANGSQMILRGITSSATTGFSEENKDKPRKQYKRIYEQQSIKKPITKKESGNFVSNNTNITQTEKKPTQEEETVQGNSVCAEEITELKEGVLEIMPDGYGFLRAHNYESGEKDAYISAQKIKKSGLRKGDWIKAEAKKTCENRPAGVVNILEVNGRDPESAYKRKNFDYLTPIYPDSRFRLEIDGAHNDMAIRSIDLVAPIGKGQRAMIVSPPKAGKTTLLKKVANSISVNYPSVHLIVLLIDERPEEVTDMQRSIKGEVVYSTFDEMPEHHTKASELVLERAKRLVELGEDVVILMDSLTRLARAYNLTIAPTGRTLSGGIDPGALHSPKRFFGAARNIENGGSLTIIATALIDTGSRMDDVIYEEFKGTGNMEIHLDRRLTEKRIFPAIDLNRSGTRREELLLTQKELETVWGMRRMLNAGDGGDASEVMISELVKTKTNKEFMEQIDMKIKMMQQQGFWKN